MADSAHLTGGDFAAAFPAGVHDDWKTPPPPHNRGTGVVCQSAASGGSDRADPDQIVRAQERREGGTRVHQMQQNLTAGTAVASGLMVIQIQMQIPAECVQPVIGKLQQQVRLI